MTLPDPKLKWNETKEHFDFGEINWDEFWNVVKGNGPCNKQRLEARKKAHEKENGSAKRGCSCIKKTERSKSKAA
jgi:ring-1,2-phenylacetyl-CoA epoxidase subunit PaaA